VRLGEWGVPRSVVETAADQDHPGAVAVPYVADDGAVGGVTVIILLI